MAQSTLAVNSDAFENLRGELRRDWLVSNIPVNDYQAYVALLTLRLQR